jgi:uncharacterized protein DUF4365
MAAREKKKRTREHIIADMSLHYLAYRVARCGYTFRAEVADYGYDGYIVTFDGDGLVENGNIFVQLKATDKLKVSASGSEIKFRISKRDIRHWQDEPFPVYLIVYDAQMRRAYWLYLQHYFEATGIRAEKLTNDSLTLRIPARNVVNLAAIKRWRRNKEQALRRIGAIEHG